MLRQLIVSKMLEIRKNALAELQNKRSELEKREVEIGVAMEEAKTEEEVKVVEESVTDLEKEVAENDTKKGELEAEIQKLEKELEDLNRNAPKNEEKRTESTEPKHQRMEGETRAMTKREKIRERINLPEVRSFYENLREAIQKRSITGLNLTIPQVMMDSITDDLGRFSVFYELVRTVTLTGEGRAIILGEAPEAVWTEMVGKINELAGLFTDVEVDGYKVGGFIPLDNSLIEDSMVNLAIYVEDLLTESIAIALDKAILYGTGTKMPLGIVPAIYADYTAGSPATGLRTTNIVKLSVADTTFAKIIKQLKHIKRGRRGRGPITIAMNEATWLGTIVPMSLGSNAAGAYVTVANQSFPGLGYKVVFSEEIPEDNIIAGDFTKYLLAQRADVKGASSSEFLFTSDKTVFKATARYDGKPVKTGAFVVLGINNVDATVSATFATDSANE